MADGQLSHSSDETQIKYFLAVDKSSRQCVNEIFTLLYRTWSRGKRYKTLQEFCEECLGWQKERLSALLQETHLQEIGNNTLISNLDSSDIIAQGSVKLRKEKESSVGASKDIVSNSTSDIQLIKSVENTAQKWKYLVMGTKNTDAMTFASHGSKLQQSNLANIPQTPKDIRVSRQVSLCTLHERHSASCSLEGENYANKPFTDEPNSRVVSSQGDRTSSQTGSSVDIPLIIKQAHKEANESSLLTSSTNCNLEHRILNAVPCPTHIPKWVLLLLIRKVFPPLPPKAYSLLSRLQKLYYVVCYGDIELDQQHLNLRLQILSNVISELISVVIDSCKEVIKQLTKETSEKLIISKERLKSSHKEFESHLEWVEKTQKELKEATQDLEKAQVNSTEILKVYSRSQSFDSTCISNVSKTTSSHEKEISGNNVPIANQTDSGNVSLVEEIGGRDLDECRQEVHSDDSDSLLVSVLREVALIERKHSSFRGFDRKFKKVLRRSQRYVIKNKRQVRDRLDSNLSAEENALSKEEIIIYRKRRTVKLSKEIKRLCKEVKAMETSRNSMVTNSTESLQEAGMEVLNEETLRLGRSGMQDVRGSEYGQLVHGTRKEARAFATRVRVLDLGKWLMNRRYATTYIMNVYSQLKVVDSDSVVNIVDILGPNEDFPSVIVLAGSKGSGKSCICQYLLHKWQSNSNLESNKLCEFDLVIYGKIGNVLSSGSWSQYLREHAFGLTLNDFAESNIYQVLENMTVLFLLDVGVPTPANTKVLKEVFSNLGNNRVIVTARSGSENEILSVAKEYCTNSVMTKICPMTPDAVEEYATLLLSNIEEDSSAKTKAIKFTKLVNSMKTTDILYPLPVAYLMHLWQEDPGLVLQATSISRLFAHVLFVAECNMGEALRAEFGGDRGPGRIKAECQTQQLCEDAWKMVSGPGWNSDDHVLLEAGHDMLGSPLITTSFRSLIVIREGMDGKKRGILPHPSVAEVLCGFFLGYQKISRHKSMPLIRRREKIEKYCIPDIKRYRYILPHAAGALVYNKHNLEDSKDIATLYMNTLNEERDMVAWMELLKECDYLSSMCSAVSTVLSCYSSWTVSHHTQDTNCAVANLLRKGAYQPRLVIISQTAKGSKIGCDSNCVIRALSTCSSTLVQLRQETQFYCWGDSTTCDSLVVPLQPPGTLQECWGHLGVEGAMALRHSHHLEELNVRISSCEALMALTQSIEHLRQSLRYLFLRLDISPSTPSSCFQPLKFKGKKLWLKLRGVENNSANWAMEVTRRLSSWYTQVLLDESSLSPSALHDLKQSLPNTTVHISSLKSKCI